MGRRLSHPPQLHSVQVWMGSQIHPAAPTLPWQSSGCQAQLGGSEELQSLTLRAASCGPES